jgi:hypothetical protein
MHVPSERQAGNVDNNTMLKRSTLLSELCHSDNLKQLIETITEESGLTTEDYTLFLDYYSEQGNVNIFHCLSAN